MLRRRFLGWHGPALPHLVQRLADPAERYADPPELDLRRHLFVFPGGRPGRRFTELLVQEAEARALRLTAPRTVSIGTLPELLYRPADGRVSADPVLSRQLWARALRELPGDRLEALVPDPPPADDPTGWVTLADEVMGLHAEVTREGLDFDTVAKRCGGDLLFDDSKRWKILAQVRRRYLESLDDLGREDPHEARISALEEEERVGVDGDGPEPLEEIHLVGVSDMPGVARALLRRVADSGTPVTAWIKAPEEWAHGFDDVGCIETETWAEAEISVPDEALTVADGPGEQATAALRAIDDFGDEYGAEEVTVGVPDEEVIPWLEQRFRRHRLPHRVAGGTPLERTAVCRLLAAVADYLDEGRFVDLAALLRHPDLSRHLDGGRALEMADRYHSDHLPGRIDGDLARPGRRSPDGPPDDAPGDPGDATGTGRQDGGGEDGARVTPEPPASLDTVVERLHGPDLLGPLVDGGRRPLSTWMAPILRLVDGVFGDRELDRRNPRQRILVEACQELRDTASSFHRLPGPADPDCRSSQAIRLLLSQLRISGASIPPDPDRGAIEILGWLELHLDDAPALVVTGFNEGFVPESVNAHPFLPDSLRTALGLVDNRARRARDAYLLSALLESRADVRIVAGRTRSAGDPLRPSRLLLTVRGESLARRVLRFAGPDREPTPPVRPPGVRIPEVSTFRTPPEPEIRLDEVPESFSVTEFRTLLQDPYRWFLERRLGLDSLHDEIRELDPLGFGSLAHDVLKTFSGTEEAASTDSRAVADRLDGILRSTARRRFGSSPLPSVPLQIEQL
ncbi:MAG: PD-(D/E)XK nuclease family protein, partial [Longimicrobiales bacterium]|nr:PD-(D/E)XK nuclease family protein [Longimicrobiales bacterium]